MAIQGGHRFTVSMDEVFPHGLYAMGVEQAMDFDERTRARKPAKDKLTGEWVWTVTCIDRDPEARQKEVRVKVTNPHQPMLPPEVLPGSGMSAVAFMGLTVTPYVEDGRGGGRSRLAFSFRATEVVDPGTGALTGGPAPSKPRTGGQPPASGEGKAA